MDILQRISRRILRSRPDKSITIKKVIKLKGLRIVTEFEIDLDDKKLIGSSVNEVKSKLLEYEREIRLDNE